MSATYAETHPAAGPAAWAPGRRPRYRGGRGGGGGGGFSPASIPSLIGWYEGGVSTITHSADVVSSIGDAAGVIGSLTKGGGGTITRIDDIKNGREGLRFDSTASHLTSATYDLAAASPHELAVVALIKLVVDGQDQNPTIFIWQNSLGNKAQFDIQSDNTFRFRYPDNTGDTIAGNAIDDGETWALVEMHRDASNVELVVDGTQVGIAASNGNPISSASEFVRFGANKSGTSQRFEGDLAALLIFAGQISTPDRAALRSYLSDNWALGL